MNNLPLNLGLICGGFFFILVFGLGLGLFFFSKNSRKKAGSSQNWPSCPGTITVSEVRQSISSDEDGNTKVSFYPHIEYTYSAGGQTQTSKQVAFGGVQGFNIASQADPMVKKYSVGNGVLVYYNPQKPQESVLERVAGKGAKTAMTMAIILFVVSALIFIPLLIGLLRN